MIRALVDFALNNRLLILAATALLAVWGVVSFHNLPVEAYPDIANNYVQIITQWPGRASEEVESPRVEWQEFGRAHAATAPSHKAARG